MKESDPGSSASGPLEGMQPVILIQQLMQRVTQMQHVDDILLWLAQTIVMRLNISAAQFWATQAYNAKPSRTELRAQASQNPGWPQQIYVNQQIIMIVDRLLRDRRGYPTLPVEEVFSPSYAQALAQYELRHWASHFLEIEALLPPPSDAPPVGKIATHANILVSLFSTQMLTSSQLRAVTFLSGQALRIAATHGLLLPLSGSAGEPANGNLTQLSQMLATIPRRLQKPGDAQVDSFLSSASGGSERNARKLYALIDGQKTLARLTQQAELNQKELVEVVRYLLHNRLIQFYTSGGDVIDDSSLALFF